jgi:hypothetical protein
MENFVDFAKANICKFDSSFDPVMTEMWMQRLEFILSNYGCPKSDVSKVLNTLMGGDAHSWFVTLPVRIQCNFALFKQALEQRYVKRRDSRSFQRIVVFLEHHPTDSVIEFADSIAINCFNAGVQNEKDFIDNFIYKLCADIQDKVLSIYDPTSVKFEEIVRIACDAADETYDNLTSYVPTSQTFDAATTPEMKEDNNVPESTTCDVSTSASCTYNNIEEGIENSDKVDIDETKNNEDESADVHEIAERNFVSKSKASRKKKSKRRTIRKKSIRGNRRLDDQVKLRRIYERSRHATIMKTRAKQKRRPEEQQTPSPGQQQRKRRRGHEKPRKIAMQSMPPKVKCSIEPHPVRPPDLHTISAWPGRPPDARTFITWC